MRGVISVIRLPGTGILQRLPIFRQDVSACWSGNMAKIYRKGRLLRRVRNIRECGYALDTTFLEDGTIYGHCYHNAIAICCIRLCKVHTPFKGIVRDVLGTGKHRINPYAYDVKIYEDIRIMPGNVGVVTNLTGKDIFFGTANDLSLLKGFVVEPSRKGVLQDVLKEGTHRINPFIQSVSIVNIQSQRYEFSGDDAIVLSLLTALIFHWRERLNSIFYGELLPV